jgi:RHS repeat-associated protein
MNIVQEQTAGAAANMLSGGVDEVFIRADATGEWNVLRDGLGSTLGLMDASGSVQSEYSYDGFGGTISTGQTSSNSSQYTGRENDNTRLYYYRSRYYSPTLQRFISEDPIGFKGGINFYAYVRNNPINYKDPLGQDLWGLTAGGSAGAAVGGLGLAGTGSYMIGYNDHGDLSGRKTSMGGAGSLGLHAGEDYSYPENHDGGGGLAATFGAGGGLFWSNAESFAELAGTFETTIISTPWGVGLEIDKSGSTYVGALTVGKGWGFGILHFKTNTPTGSIWETECRPINDIYGPGSPGSFVP